jgi:hypothetical protein
MRSWRTIFVQVTFAEQIPGLTKPFARRTTVLTAEVLMSAEADAACGAEYGQVSPERTNSRNGYRMRPWDAGSAAPWLDGFAGLAGVVGEPVDPRSPAAVADRDPSADPKPSTARHNNLIRSCPVC